MKRTRTHRLKGWNDINWLEQLIQLLVVVISITLAFMVNRYYENYKNRQLERKYLHSFFSEILSDQAQIDSLITENTARLENRNKFVQFLEWKSLPGDSLLPLFAEMLVFRTFEPNMTTYEAIKSTGNFNLIANYDLQENLIQYYHRLEDKKYIDTIFDNYLNQYIIPFAFENVDFTQQRFSNEKSLNLFKFKNLALGYYNLLQQNVAFYKNIQKIGQDLNQMLATEMMPADGSNEN